MNNIEFTIIQNYQCEGEVIFLTAEVRFIFFLGSDARIPPTNSKFRSGIVRGKMFLEDSLKLLTKILIITSQIFIFTYYH